MAQKMAIGGAPISQMYADEIGARRLRRGRLERGGFVSIFHGQGPPPKAKSKIESINEVKHEREQSRAQDSNAKSKFQILYWQDIPSEIKVWDDFDEVKISLPEKFVIRIDAAARKQGLISQEAYSAHFRWSNAAERAGSPHEVAEALKKELEAKFP